MTNISFQYYEAENRYFFTVKISLVCYTYLTLHFKIQACIDFSLKLFSTNIVFHT